MRKRPDTAMLVLVLLVAGCSRGTSQPAVSDPPSKATLNRTESGVGAKPHVIGSVAASVAEEAWQSLLGRVDLTRAVAGNWTKADGSLIVQAATGARIALPATPKGDYDLRVTFTRRTGRNSIAILFPHGNGRAAFEVDAWDEHLAGIQNVAGQTIRNNPTRRPNVALENGQTYTLVLEVRAKTIRGYLNDQLLVTLLTDGRDLTLSDLWTMPNDGSLALGAWDSETVFHAIDYRQTERPSEFFPAASAPPPAPPAPQPRPSTTEIRTPVSKRVLIVLANHHFFYREYGDPRAELEKAGIRVTVAAGNRGPCRPHAGSGEGRDGGVVQAEIALADVKADDYDAVLFSGGWGSSAYQFAFTGRYDDVAYNGTPAVRREANRVIGDFLKQDKYVCALCNAVSVLAWARVDGGSPLRGKRVCAPTREAASGIYEGRRAQPSCRWHPERNGAILVPAGSIGRPNTAEDDVVVDGRIVTGEDDISAREMGRRIVQLLKP